MATEIASRLWRRRYQVDDSGVSEFQWDGSPLRFIPWDQLAQIHLPPSLSFHSSYGDRIKPRLDLVKKKCLMESVVAEWRVRFPEAWREEKARHYRLCRRETFIYTPLVFAILLLLCYSLPWIPGWPVPKRAKPAKLNRLAVMAAVCVGARWFFYFKWERPESVND
jgi:hypothetical protein